MEWDLTLRESISLIFILIGTAFMVIAALGILRMPDLFLRMSMTTKAATFGVGSILVASVIFFSDDLGVAARAVATLIFVFLTAPVSAHMIGRAAYLDQDVELWEKTHTDELKGNYDVKKKILTSTGEHLTLDLESMDEDTIEKAISD